MRSNKKKKLPFIRSKYTVGDHIRKTRPTLLTSTILPFTLLSACSLVEPQPGSNSIIFSNHQESCELIDTKTLEVMSEMLWMSRLEKTIADELIILAKNEAINANANAIWSISDIVDGQQTFELYQCR